MGCHTWCYKPSNVTLKEAKKIAKEWVDNYKEHLEKLEVDFIEKHWDDVYVWRDYYYYSTTGLVHIDEKVWISDDKLPHDIFRTTGVARYTSQVMKSLQDTLDFIKKYNQSISVEEMQKLKEYWKQYPNGLIKFG